MNPSFNVELMHQTSSSKEHQILRECPILYDGAKLEILSRIAPTTTQPASLEAI